MSLRNTGPIAASGVRLVDALPVGFRYAAGSAHLGEGALRVRAGEPVIDASGRGLSFPIGILPPQASVTLRYVVRIGAGARPGEAINTAQGFVGARGSNVAAASVQVTNWPTVTRTAISTELT